ncbi:hypothetical protein KIL84_004353 [Mauremys mutica]|uniref:Uncharacterized protein n=1 Tax=Mauremys mutica TaxID=74926 RepID=A0A9D3XN04_9SAUR|nr:hypothetical protein KIL84_004353 [Mauremys mutica]
MAYYKMPTDAKKLKLPLGAPAYVQKRQPAYTYFPEEASPILNPVFYPEIEPKNQGDSMGPSPVVSKAKDVKVLQDRMQRHLLLTMMKADLRSGVRWPALFYDKLLQNYKRLNIFMLFWEEEDPVYMVVAMVSLEDGEANSQAVTDDCLSNGNIIMVKQLEVFTQLLKKNCSCTFKICSLLFLTDN